MLRWKNWTMIAALTGALGASAVVVGPAAISEAAPTYRFSTVVSGLTVPWDLTFVGDVMLYDQRPGGIWSKRGDDAPQRVQIATPAPLVASEGGMLGMVADPKASTNRIFYTCQTVQSSKDVQVFRWRLSEDARSATRVGDGPLVKGIPVSDGRHSGCRLRFSAKGMLYIGTGDAAQEKNPQRKSSLGGKVLRIYPDGRIPTTNPFYSSGGNARYVWNYGHRNVQGLALEPATGRMYSAEHGSFRDDEVNLVRKGANYGWDPGPGYDESPPMTDRKKFPHAVKAIWSSGNPTVATSGLTFLTGSRWGSWEGELLVARLKGTGILILVLNADGKVTHTKVMPGTKSYGRIRTVQEGPDGSLYFTTSNSQGSQTLDRIVRVTTT